MFNAVFNFCAFCVVEVIKSSYKITGDSADSFKMLAVFLFSSAFRTFVTDNSGESAFRVAVNRVVNASVANAGFLHAADNLLKSIKVLERVAVEFDIGDMTRVGKSMIRSFPLILSKAFME